MGDLSKNFSKSEFACHCGCGAGNVSPRLVAALQKLRDLLDQPMTILSGYRCPKHNRACGGAMASLHMSGLAADVRLQAGPDDSRAAELERLSRLYRAALQVPELTGIGVYLRPGGWIHLDVRSTPARWAEDEKRRPMAFAAAAARLEAVGRA